MIKQYQLKDGSVRYSYIAYVGIDPLTGKEKRVRKRGFKTKKEAKIAESQFLLKVGQDGFFDKPDRIMAIILAITHEKSPLQFLGKGFVSTFL